jgi:hypothetical protein
VQPVSLVDADISIPASNTLQTSPTTTSGGQLTNPAAAAVIADTGQLGAGNWTILVIMGSENVAAAAVSRSFDMQHRNAANGANIWANLISVGFAGGGNQIFAIRDTFAANERLRFIMGPTGSGALEIYQVTLFIIAS